MLVKYYILIIGFLILACNSRVISKNKQKKPIPVIFETDMGNDIDDALALDMLYKYMDQRKVRILAVSTNNDDLGGPGFVDIMNTWYGYPEIPVGRVVNGIKHKHNRSANYAAAVYHAQNHEGSPKYVRTVAKTEDLPDAVELYRKILSKQKDHSVTIISVGFSTNLGRLLDTSGDKYSSLNGLALVAKKVKLLSIMAGSFSDNVLKEFNVVNDIVNARNVFDKWPGDIVVTPFETGLQVKYPAESIMKDFKWADSHPLTDAYKAYRKMPYDNYTWDLMAVLYAVEPYRGFFTVSSRGNISVDENGYTTFYPSNKGKHICLSATTTQAEKIKNRFIDLMTCKPAVFQINNKIQ